MLLHRGPQTVEIDLNARKNPAVTAKLGGRVIWRGIRKDWDPWKIAIADVDGDGIQDLVVGLYMHTRHSPHRIHTLYVYGFDGTAIYPKWRGSRLARDFVDFFVAKSPKGNDILTLDRLLDGRFALSCYAWSGFGLTKEWESGHWKRARLLAIGRGFVTVVTEDGPVKFSLAGHS